MAKLPRMWLDTASIADTSISCPTPYFSRWNSAHIAPAAPTHPARYIPMLPRPLSGVCASGSVTYIAGVSQPMPPMCQAIKSVAFQSR